MNIARQVAKYEEKGFSREQAEINGLIENAIFAIFQDFPDAFLHFGGATLVLFHDSVRHFADLDLLARGTSLPTRDEIIGTMRRDLWPIPQILQLGELQFGSAGSSTEKEVSSYRAALGSDFSVSTLRSLVRESKTKLKRVPSRHRQRIGRGQVGD